MARAAKTPKFDLFNGQENCFGLRQTHERDLKQVLLDFSGEIICEFGCGAAELAIEVARRNPDSLVLAVDLKSDRMAKPARRAAEEGLDNVLFLQADTRRIEDHIPFGVVDRLWVTFPDPFPRSRQAKHRQTHPQFLRLYAQLLHRVGELHFKTDDQRLFEYSIETIVGQGWDMYDLLFDLHNEENPEEGRRNEAKILTVYEKRWHADGLTTKYLAARPPKKVNT